MVRYVLPQLPLFCLLAGGLLAGLLRGPVGNPLPCYGTPRVPGRGQGVRLGVGATLTALATLSALLWCVAYLSLYAHPDSRLQALAWVQQHARPGTIS